jgi:PAS domain S-box-containing protein
MKPLRTLIVEDYDNDALLIELELQRAGYTPVCHRVETGAQLRAALERQAWDLVIADYLLPQFDGLEALALVKERGLDLPFIVVSGNISDDKAVAAMKAGAHDYLMKDNLSRLGPAVERELREAAVRRERRLSEERLRAEHQFREAIEDAIPTGIATVDLSSRQTHVNPAFCAMVGWSEAELIGARAPFVYWPADQREAISAALGRVVAESAGPAPAMELRFCRRNSERLDVLLQVTPLKDSSGNITGWVSAASDITDRKRAEARLAAEHAITRILARCPSLAEAGPELARKLLEGLEADVGTLWVPGERTPAALEPSCLATRAPDARLRAFLKANRRFSFAPGQSLPGRVWQERHAIWITDVGRDSGFERRNLAAAAGLQSAVGFPIQNADGFYGVFEFFTARRLEADLELLNMMNAIGTEIGQFIRRRNAEEALRQAHDGLELRVQQRTADLATANAKLQAAILERERLERELLEITEKERRRIGLDLHDDLGQKLSGIALMTKGLELKLENRGVEEAGEAARIRDLVQQTMSHARDLAHDLAALDLKENDLSAALEDLAAHARDLFGIACRFQARGPIPPLPLDTATQLYKIAQEALTNAIKHGRTRRVTISLGGKAGRLALSVRNNGVPFPDPSSPSHQGMGLRIMRYRANLIGGSLEIRAAGRNGTSVACSVPVAPGPAPPK